MYGCDNSSLTLREERRLRWFVNRVVRKIVGSKSKEVTVEWRNNIMKNLVICIYHQFFRRPIQEEIIARVTEQVWGRGEMYTEFCEEY